MLRRFSVKPGRPGTGRAYTNETGVGGPGVGGPDVGGPDVGGPGTRKGCHYIFWFGVWVLRIRDPDAHTRTFFGAGHYFQ